MNLSVQDMFDNFCKKCPRCRQNKDGELSCGPFFITMVYSYNPWATKQKIYWVDKFERPADCNFELEAILLEDKK